jgi:anaerobic selenocysteine-containing dehydrogenase
MTTSSTQQAQVREDVWIPTSCGGCYAQCGIKVRRVDGTIVDIEGNPDIFKDQWTVQRLTTAIRHWADGWGKLIFASGGARATHHGRHT